MLPPGDHPGFLLVPGRLRVHLRRLRVRGAHPGRELVNICRHCGEPIEPCPTCPPEREVTKGWRHVGYDSQPMGGHFCGGRTVNALAEPAAHNCRFEYCTAPTGECENPE